MMTAKRWSIIPANVSIEGPLHKSPRPVPLFERGGVGTEVNNQYSGFVGELTLAILHNYACRW